MAIPAPFDPAPVTHKSNCDRLSGTSAPYADLSPSNKPYENDDDHNCRHDETST